MTQEIVKGRPTDADLIAYLDDELGTDQRARVANWLGKDRELRDRLRLLESGGRHLREAFDTLLAEAPHSRLADMLASIRKPPPALVVRSWIGWNWLRAGPVAAGIALFVAGIAADHVFPQIRDAVGIGSEREDDDDWRQIVAEYIALYTPETFAGLPQEATASERQLATVGKNLGVPLSLPRVSFAGASFRWAQLFNYDGKPLGQLTYLDAQNDPLALCIFLNNQPDARPTSEQRVGLNIVHWASHGRAFMLVGRVAMHQLQNIASSISQQIIF
jgi:anti-sigma factor RsiW